MIFSCFYGGGGGGGDCAFPVISVDLKISRNSNHFESAFFWDFTQLRMIVFNRLFELTSERNYHSTLRDIPKELRSHLHCGEILNSLKSHHWTISEIDNYVYYNNNYYYYYKQFCIKRPSSYVIHPQRCIYAASNTVCHVSTCTYLHL